MREGLDSSPDVSSDKQTMANDVNATPGSTTLKGEIEYGTLLETGAEQMEDAENMNDNSVVPPGDNDLYMLKSQMVPPVCPA